MAILACVAGVVSIAIAMSGAPLFLGALVFIPLALAAVFFGSLLVTVTDGDIELRFGPGGFGRRIPIGLIRSWRLVQNPWYYGWGIHFTPQGTLYNVGGFDAVELALTDGSLVRIGTDEPRRLSEVLARVISASPTEESQSVSGRPVRTIAIACAALLTPVIMISAVWYAGTRPVVVSVVADVLEVKDSLYSTRIHMTDVRRLTLDADPPAVRTKVNGFALRGIQRGRFRLADSQLAWLFINRKASPFITVQTDSSLLIFNLDDPELTGDTFADLAARTGRK